MFIEHSTPMGELIKKIAEQLHGQGNLRLGEDEERQDWAVMKKYLTRIGSVKAQAPLVEGITRSQRQHLIFFDNLDRISRTGVPGLSDIPDIQDIIPVQAALPQKRLARTPDSCTVSSVASTVFVL